MGNNLSVAQERIAEFDLSEFAYNLIKENPLGYANIKISNVEKIEVTPEQLTLPDTKHFSMIAPDQQMSTNIVLNIERFNVVSYGEYVKRFSVTDNSVRSNTALYGIPYRMRPA